MNQKVLGSVFVLAIVLGITSVTLRSPGRSPVAPAPSARPEPEPARVDSEDRPIMKKGVPRMDRAAASYRVYEYGVVNGMDFRGAGYNARVSADAVRFGSADGKSLEIGAPTIEQGSRVVPLAPPVFSHPAFGSARLERGPVTEEYVFENRRMEQLFRIPAALGAGDLRIHVPLAANFPSVMETRAPKSDAWGAPEFKDGGVAVLDPTGAVRFTCTSAVVLDAAGKRLALAPRHENNEMLLEVPASFLSGAAYPVVVDPWFGTDGSNTGGGLSGTGAASDRPSMRDNAIAWADNSTGNWEIYVKIWNGSFFTELAGSASGGGVSNTPGDSINPSVASDGSGSPTVAWEDNTGGVASIYLKQYPSRGNGTAWLDLGGSSTNLGLSGSFGANRFPTVGLLSGVVPGSVTVDANGNAVSSAPTFVACPVVAWESGLGIYCSAWYPGAPAIPPSNTSPGFPLVPAGWYQLGKAGGTSVNSDLFNQSLVVDGGTGGSYPKLVVDFQNQVTITWESAITGNFEIFATRWTLANPANGTDFQIVAASSSQFNMLPKADFHGIANNGGSLDLVSNTPTPSEFPAICIDGAGGLNIAWQETESIPGPNPATSSQIYLMNNAGGAGTAWTALGISTSPGGISRTGLSYDGAGQTPPVPGNASTPDVAANGRFVAVAWADTSNSRSSIYVRRFDLLGAGTWDQIGFQGSAFPPRLPLILPPAVPEEAPIGGVSQSPNYSYQPQITMYPDGSPVVAWADGSGSTFDILAVSFWPNGPGQAAGIGTANPTFNVNIRQTLTDPSLPGGAVDVPPGGFATGTAIYLSASVFTETLNPPGTQLWLQFEVQPAGTPFTFRANYQSLFQAPDTPPATLPPPPATSLAVLKLDGLPNGDYWYRTRTIDQMGRVSPWFQQATIGNVAFRINAAQAAGGGSNGPSNSGSIVGTTKSRSACGLLGFEGILILGLIRRVRRNRRR